MITIKGQNHGSCYFFFFPLNVIVTQHCPWTLLMFSVNFLLRHFPPRGDGGVPELPKFITHIRPGSKEQASIFNFLAFENSVIVSERWELAIMRGDLTRLLLWPANIWLLPSVCSQFSVKNVKWSLFSLQLWCFQRDTDQSMDWIRMRNIHSPLKMN